MTASLPSERALAEMLNLSRVMTIRRAYDELRAKNYLETRGRLGVTAKPRPGLTPRLDRLKGFTEEMRELGMEPSTRLLERSVVTDRTLASIFSRPSTATFLRLVRLRLGDGVPLSRELAWYDLTAAPALAEWDVQGLGLPLSRPALRNRPFPRRADHRGHSEQRSRSGRCSTSASPPRACC